MKEMPAAGSTVTYFRQFFPLEVGCIFGVDIGLI
jgi:hypothetical protein